MIKNKSVVIIGSGINGLVCANYLRKVGFNVTILESSHKIGGACTSEKILIKKKEINYSTGATVLGMMPDFIFKETGLSNKITSFSPSHPKLVYFPGDKKSTKIYKDSNKLSKELRLKWDEKGDMIAFREDKNRIVDFIRKGYKNGETPCLEKAKAFLGDKLTELWISGNAKELLDHYFTSEKTKIYMGMTVIESGPTSIKSPFSAFTIPLMDSGSIFNGYWGYVKGGIGEITKKLGEINDVLNIKTQLNISIESIDSYKCIIKYNLKSKSFKLDYDYLIFATDPITPSKLLRNTSLIENLNSKKYIGSSGKITVFFEQPVIWKENSTCKDFDSAFRFIFSIDTLEQFEDSSQKILNSNIEYEPGYIQVYCEGGAQRKLSNIEPFDKLIFFTKNFSFKSSSDQLTVIENKIKNMVFKHIVNPKNCVYSIFLSPLDLKEKFRFPMGNIDHLILENDQTFNSRSFSTDKKNNFYRYWDYENIFYCGAGAYPCGSVAGTPGYILSKQLYSLVLKEN